SFFIHVCVEPVAREFGEAFNVVQRNLAHGGMDSVADLQLLEGFAKRVSAGVFFIRTPDPATTGVAQRFGRTLQRGPLHVMEHASYSAQLLAAARPSRSAMSQMRQGRSMPG